MFQINRDIQILLPTGILLGGVGFTLSLAGDMRKIHIVKDFFRTSDLHPRKIVILEQIHSTNIAIPDALHLGDVEVLEESDGVVSIETGVALTVHVADCVPVLYYDPVAKVIGASHNGWRGSVRNMMKKMITKMETLGGHAQNIRIAFGPSIGPCCYNVDMDRYVLFMEEMERFEKLIFKPHGGEFHLNLLRLNYELALESGILVNHIDYSPFCTSCDSERFFSYRRQHKKHPEQFGEMMGYIMLP